jgi:prepilin-type N-terminal cleavage/methylation domain-containing protein/prepilin-type processing-associated H-X9-DG protein
MGRHRCTPSRGLRTRQAFTLLELLIVVLIVALLIALLTPSVRATRARVRQLNCTSNLRNVTMQFQFFADNQCPRGRGDSDRLGANRFRINDFLDSLYRLNKFWDVGTAPQATLQAGREPAMCPAGARQLITRIGYPCGDQAIKPLQAVSFGVNMRLYRGQFLVSGRVVLAPVNVTYVPASILDHPYVPIMLDVDGDEAVQRGLMPFYVAPPIVGEDSPYSSGRYWMPSRRHPGGVNVAFVGGHVLRSARPEQEAWNWNYRASVGN